MHKATVKISDCVHFRGFRYGGHGENIYEDYTVGLSTGIPVKLLRMQLMDRVLAFNASSFNTILNIQLSKSYPPWKYPWNLNSINLNSSPTYSAKTNPDIICHASPEGVMASHLNREFFWLERAHSAIRSGYTPNKFGYIRLLPLVDGSKFRYIVLDGNHRIASMHALGHKYLEAEILGTGIRFKHLSKIWPGVLFRRYVESDARLIFERYFVDKNVKLSLAKRQKLIIDEPVTI